IVMRLRIFPYTTLFRSNHFVEMPTTSPGHSPHSAGRFHKVPGVWTRLRLLVRRIALSACSAVRFSRRMLNEAFKRGTTSGSNTRSEEHTSELQSRSDLV